MEITTQRIEEAKNKYETAQNHHRFILTTYGPGNEKTMLRVPDNFIATVGNNIPPNVILQFPNGREVHLHYKRTVKSFNHLDPLYKELGGEVGFFLILSYKGFGIFSVDVIDKEKTEIEYGWNRRIARAPVTVQDKAGGKRWKFLAYADGPISLNGSIPIPPGFLERFKNIIPASVAVSLVNGEEIQCKYLKKDGRLYGLLPLVQKKYAENWDVLIFTYRGNGKFNLGIFDSSRTEKSLGVEVVVVESDTEIESEKEEAGGNGNQLESAYTTDSEDIEDAPLQFSKVLSWSNTNGSTHGVHIPVRIKPANREWIAGETVTLRNGKGEWTVGIVLSSSNARFSSGWNKFSSDNNLSPNQEISFSLVEEINGLVFYVE